MGPRLSHHWVRVALAISAVAGAALGLSACSAQQANNPDVVAGKVLFVQKCGACHTLSRAQTKGVVGPNLDEAFQQSIKDGLGRSGIRGAVHGWILHPNSQSVMPAKLVTGEDAYDVASYVAESVAKPGKDTGLLATAVKPAGAGKPAVEKAGTLQIDADPNGQTAYVTNKATGTAGEITVKMNNKSGVQHDIVIDGKGKGQIVANGGTSQFKADFQPGTYTFYCSVDGHRQAGMQGKLTVK